VIISLFSGVCLLLCVPNVLPSPQEIDPFYLGLLQKGESSYLSGKYDNAIRQLKTSLFGLHPDKTLQAKALIYLSLSSYYMKETSQSREYLEQALDLLGGESFSGVDINERIRGELSGLAAHFKLGEYTPEEPQTKIVTKPVPGPSENSPEPGDPNHSIKDLEDIIADNPGNIGSYYDLYELYMQKERRSKARKTLEKLVKAHPDEIQGYYLLGLMRFRDKKYKDAENHFREALRPWPNITLSNELVEELKTYHILSVYYLGDKKRALDMMSVSVHLYTEAKIRQLPISGPDKATLREIIREYMKH